MDRELQDNHRATQTTEMIETTRGILAHLLSSMGAMTIRTSLVAETTEETEIVTMVDRDTTVAEDMTADKDATRVREVVETITGTWVEMIANEMVVSTEMEEGQEVRETTTEDDQTQL